MRTDQMIKRLQAAVVKEDYDELVRLQTRFDLEPPTALPNFDKIYILLMLFVDTLIMLRDATRKGEMAEVKKQSIRKNELKKQLLQELQKLTTETQLSLQAPTDQTISLKMELLTTSKIVKEYKESCDSLFILNVITNGVIRHYEQILTDFGRPQLLQNLGFWNYTLHDDKHSLRIQQYISQLTANLSIELNPIEKSILDIATYAHDIGMVYFPIDEKEVELSLEDIRKKHGEIAAQMWEDEFNNHYKEFFSQIIEGVSLGSFSLAVSEAIRHHHGKGKPTAQKVKVELKNNTSFDIDIYTITGLLRLADQMDCTYERIWNQLRTTIPVAIALAHCWASGSLRESIKHYIKHLVVQSVEVKDNEDGIHIDIYLRELPGSKLVFFPNSNPLEITQEELSKMIANEFEKELAKPEGAADLLKNSFRSLRKEIQYDIKTIDIPIPIEKYLDREQVVFGLKKLIKSEYGKEILSECKPFSTEEEVYVIM